MFSETDFIESIHRRLRNDTRVMEVLAHLYTRDGRFAEGLRLDRKIVRIQPSCATARYNLACSLALTGKRSDAVEALKAAIALGYDDFDWIRKDRDLTSLRQYPPFIDLLSSNGG